MHPVYVIDGARTPFLKAQKGPGPFGASDLATQAGRALLLRQPFAPSDLDEVILGCAAPSPDETNIGRMVALRGADIIDCAIADAIREPKLVSPNGELVTAARSLGVSFGD